MSTPFSAASPAPLAIASVHKRFGRKSVLADVSLAVQPGACVALLGPSGSGKSTLLNVIAGFERPDAGDILVRGRSVLALPSHRRSIGMVFQHYALFPHLNVAQNIAYPLVRKGVAAPARRRRVLQLLEMVRLDGYAEQPIRALSGGQQQRVAIARALAAEPDVLLMDEPMGALDRVLSEELQVELKQLLQASGTTVVYVTHDQREALALADSIAIMRDGRIAQFGAAEELYARPATAFVARFLWSGANSLPARLLGVGRPGEVVVEVQGQAVAAHWMGTRPAAAGAVQIVVRPEDVEISDASAVDPERIPATVATTMFSGDRRALRLRLPDGAPLNAIRPLSAPALQPGAAVAVGWRPQHAHAFPVDGGEEHGHG